LSDFSPSEKGGFVFCFQLSEMRHIYDFMIEKDQPLEKDHPLGFCVVDFFTIPQFLPSTPFAVRIGVLSDRTLHHGFA